MESSMVRLVDVVKSFDGGKDAAVKGISLNVNAGEFFTILGPSGCGKTTTLRIIAGFERVDSGSIFIDDTEVSLKAPHERNVNTVFQNYALFPHLNVFDNVAFGLSLKKVAKNIIRDKVLDMLKIVQMEGFENRMPDQLSGGQRQRVAIARAIINNPKVLLLDEPLGALDYKLRKQMQFELKHLQKQLGITFIFVTHDQEEAMSMSDRICVMNNGVIEQVGIPEEIYERPGTRFVADFIGETNIFEGKVLDIVDGYATIETRDSQNFHINGRNLSSGDSACFAVRPERLKLLPKSENREICMPVMLKERSYTGSIVKTIVTLENGREITINEPAAQKFVFPDSLKACLTWDPDCMVVLKS